jgi:uncharacterized protein YunC (DUF1805 family)
MEQKKIQLGANALNGYCVDCGPLKLLTIVGSGGAIGCGLMDMTPLDKFGFAGARVKSASGQPMTTIDELLTGVVRDANETAAKKGVKPGMSGREALDKMMA